MNAKSWVALTVLTVALSGCGNQNAPPSTAADSKQNQGNFADRANATAQREANRLHEDWQRMASDVKQSASRVQEDLDAELRRQREEMAEFAAQMAEDAKDRALDIPDVLDEFFGAPADERAQWPRTERPGSSSLR